MRENGPLIRAIDIIGGTRQRNDVTLFAEMHGARLRYRLHIDEHVSQSYFLVEAFSLDTLTWHEVWSIPQHTYEISDEPRDYATVSDPASRFLASPYSRNLIEKAASWQKIVHELTRRADMLLRPPSTQPVSLELHDGEDQLLTVTAHVSSRDGAAVVEIDTAALGTGRECRVFVNDGPIFAANPDTGNHDTDRLAEYTETLLRARSRGSKP